MSKAYDHVKDSAIQRWRSQVSRHHQQSISAQEKFNPSIDFWKQYAPNFRDDPFRENDAIVLKLLEEFQDCQTILDIGGGAGRLALPLALVKKAVTVVDSSEAMLSQLNMSAEEARIENVKCVNKLWEEIGDDFCLHDGSIISHVTYGIEDIEKFILNTSRYTAKTVVALAFSESPQAYLGDIWEVVHDEVRVHLPGANELMDVLVYMGLKPEMELLETLSPHNYHSHSDALQDIRNRLYVNANSEKDVLLKDSLTRMLNGVVSSDGDAYELKGSVNRALCLIRWDFT